MFEDNRKKFWDIYHAKYERVKINEKALSKKIGVSHSTIYKFHHKCAGSPNLLESISIEVFERPWMEVIARQEAERNQGQDADTRREGGSVNIGDLYERLGEIRGTVNKIDSELKSINHKLDAHLSNIQAHAHDDKKNNSGTS